MKNLRNRVNLIGHLGNDPEMKAFENGKKLATLSLATSDVYKNQKGEKVTETQWHRVIAWGKTAELMEKYLKKGQEVAIEGRLINRSYEKDGRKNYITEVEASEMLMVGGKS